jgi:hypothetical protein
LGPGGGSGSSRVALDTLGTLAVRVSIPRSPASSVAARTIDWLPVFPAGAYAVVVAAKFPALTRALYWNSDAASAFVFGRLLRGHGTVEIPRFGWWTSMWWLLATRGLPGYKYLWEVTGYVFALATAAILGWATARVAGRWAGLAAASIAVVVGPKALTSLLTVNWHTSTPFTAAVLAAYLVVLMRTSSWLLTLGVGVLAGANAASDPLLWIAGITPFAVGVGVLAVRTHRRDIAARATVLLAVVVACFVATDRIMSSLGFHIIPVGVQFARAADLVANFIKLGKSVALVFGANHFFPGVYPSTPIRYAITLLAFAALALTIVAAVRLTLRRADPSAQAYACYWASTAILLGLGYWATNEGTGVGAGGGVNYVLSLPAAAGVGVALTAARSPLGRIVASLAIAVVGIANIAGITAGRSEPRGGADLYGRAIIRLLEHKGLTHGYGPFWDAQSLTWKSDTRLLVAPVQQCPRRGRALCRFSYFTIASWYKPRPGPSFLIVDPPQGLSSKPPSALGPPSEVHRIGPEVTVYLYPHDIGSQIRRSS